jgi:hypothetical protein
MQNGHKNDSLLQSIRHGMHMSFVTMIAAMS